MCTIHVIEKDDYVKNAVQDIDNHDFLFTKDFMKVGTPNICIINTLIDSNVVHFIDKKLSDETVTIVITDDMSDKNITELIYSGASWVVRRGISEDSIRAYLWRAIKMSSGIRMLNKAGKLSNEVRNRIRQSLSELEEVSLNKEMIA